ncbi:MAG: hypothetical protein AAF602_23960 [Myxococcota bacterium]
MSWGLEAAIVIGVAMLGILILPGGRSRPSEPQGSRTSAQTALRGLRAAVPTPLTLDPLDPAEPPRRA